jgi:hypothetical protein
MAVYLAFTVSGTGNTTTLYTWNNLLNTGGTDVALVDESGAANGDLASWESNGGFGTTSNTTTSGDAKWVEDSNSALNAAFTQSNAAWKSITLKNLDDTKLYFFEAFASRVDGRFTNVRVNGGTLISLANGNGSGGPNLSITGLFTGISPVAGEILIEYTSINSSAAYLNAARYGEEVVTSSITLTQSEITPNGTISGSYANWGGTAPTKLEGIRGANSIGTDTGEITGFTVTGDGTSGTFTATIADLPASASAQYLRFSDTGIADPT